MTWSAAGSLRGPAGRDGVDGVPGADGAPGTPGAPGRGIAATALQPDGTLLITFSDTTQVNVGVIKGVDGKDGTSVSIDGSVATAADLPSGLTTADKGVGYISQDDGHLHVWDGTTFVDAGSIKGPAGDPGIQGPQGIRGTTWFTGNGAPPETVSAGQMPGDLYLDLIDGTVYTLS